MDQPSLCYPIGVLIVQPLRSRRTGSVPHNRAALQFVLAIMEDINYDNTNSFKLLIFMISSNHIVILSKIANLASMYGLKLSESAAVLEFQERQYHLIFPGAPTDEDGFEKFDQMMKALGGRTEDQEIVSGNIDDLSALLDNAIRLAPRSKVRTR